MARQSLSAARLSLRALLTDLRHDMHVFWLSWTIQFRAATHYRAAFALQVVGMIINNAGLLIAWLFLFSRFGTINGWSAVDLIGVQGINMLIFSAVMMFCGGFLELSRYIDQGAFDSFLTKPTAILPQIAASRIEIATVGDLLMGLVLTGWYAIHIHATPLSLLIFLAAFAIGVIAFWCFTLMPYLLAFYLLDSDKIARNIGMFFLDTGLYPSGVLSGTLRTVLLTAFPGLLIGVIPLDALRGLHWGYVLLSFGVALCWLAITLMLFTRSLRRYESTNLIGAR